MSIIEIIKERKSVRSYTDEPIKPEILSKLRTYISQLSAPFGVQARVELLDSKPNDQPIKLGTYGVISGANYFLALIIDDSPKAEIGAGYMFEQLILYCTELGLNTCWLGGTFNQSDFSRQIEFKDNERLVIISPVGYKREKRRLLESIMRAGAGSDNRKPFESLFFKDTFEQPLSSNEAGGYITPLEMVRLAPSASNKQPWRVIKQGNQFHFYHRPNRFSLNDMGIALCHFELTCKELGIKGNFQMIDNAPSNKDVEYAISWVVE